MAEVEVENLISEAMTARGLTRATDIETADIAVNYSVSTGSGRGSGNSMRNLSGMGSGSNQLCNTKGRMQVLLYKVRNFNDVDGATIVR